MDVTEELKNAESKATVIMEEELKGRENDMKVLAEVNEMKKAKDEILERKRKFLDEIPVKLTAMKTAFIDDMEKSFVTWKKELLNVNVGGDDDEVGEELDDNMVENPDEEEEEGEKNNGNMENEIVFDVDQEGQEASNGNTNISLEVKMSTDEPYLVNNSIALAVAPVEEGEI